MRPSEEYSVNDLIIGNEVRFTCVDGGNEDFEPNYFEFRYKINGGNWIELGHFYKGWGYDDEFERFKWKGISDYLVLEKGRYELQCKVCKDSCTSWEDRDCQFEFDAIPPPEVCNARDDDGDCTDPTQYGDPTICDCEQYPGDHPTEPHAVKCDPNTDESWTYKLYQDNKLNLDRATLTKDSWDIGKDVKNDTSFKN